MRWSEIDLEAGLLNLPAARMKAGNAFRVPLSAAAAEILRSLPREDEQFVFPSTVQGKSLSSPTFTRLLERYGVPGKPHGVRSTFAGWAADAERRSRSIDASLAHHVGTAVTRAYVRGDFLTARRELPQRMGALLHGETPPMELARSTEDEHDRKLEELPPEENTAHLLLQIE